jgi:hypothetical protein
MLTPDDPEPPHPAQPGKPGAQVRRDIPLGTSSRIRTGGLEIAVYPERVRLTRTPIALTPSGALRFVEDPDRIAAAARTAGTRQTVAASGGLRHPRPGGETTPTPDREQTTPTSAPTPAAPATPAPAPARDWSAPLVQPARRRAWWRRMLEWFR